MVLWTPWVHQGRIRARTETELIELNSEKFREVIVEHPKHLPFMRCAIKGPITTTSPQ